MFFKMAALIAGDAKCDYFDNHDENSTSVCCVSGNSNVSRVRVMK